MIAYVDSSVLLRKVLRQPGSLKEWRGIQTGRLGSGLAIRQAAPGPTLLRFNRDMMMWAQADVGMQDLTPLVQGAAPT